MLIEQPPKLFRLTIPEGVFRVPASERGGEHDRTVFLTFDDGPIPEVTPWVLDTLDRFGAKATFFMVGDNARRHPELVREVLERGHDIGNHTMHHVRGTSCGAAAYLADVAEAAEYLPGAALFRPPHGWLRRCQARALARDYRIVMYDLVTRDYSRKLTPRDVADNVRRYARPGAIIVFHDSLKSLPRLREALPEALGWLRGEGYRFGLLRHGSGSGGRLP